MRRFVQAVASDAVQAALAPDIRSALSDAPPRYNIASNGEALVLVLHDGENKPDDGRVSTNFKYVDWRSLNTRAH